MRGLEIAVPSSVVAARPFFTPTFAARADRERVAVAKLNCAGRECPEREGCRRYLVMVPNGKRTDTDGREHPHFEWASFDVERITHGTCSAFAVLAQARPIR